MPVTRVFVFNCPARPGLSTVGYELQGLPGWPSAARTAAGVSEARAGSGVYWVSLTLAPDYTGKILWDTGDASPFYGAEEIDLTAAPPAASGPPGTPAVLPPSSGAPAVAFCTDEDIAVRCYGDYVTLCPSSQLLAAGTDGAVVGGSWNLASASNSFDAQGVARHSVLTVTGPNTSPFRGSGQLFAVESAAGGTVVLRRLGQAAGVGLPPAPTTQANLVFAVPTFAPQVEDASYDLATRFGLDPAVFLASAGYVEDLRVFRQATVLTVLKRQLQTMTRTSEGDWGLKLKGVADELDDTMARVVVRWGPNGTARPSSGKFGTRYGR